MDPNKIFEQIEDQVANLAKKVAIKVYEKLGTRYNVPSVPTHTHTGQDTNRINYKDIVQGTKYVTGLSITNADAVTDNETITIGGVFNPTRIIFQGFVANNAITAYTLTGALIAGDTAADLTDVWDRPSGVYPVTFSNGELRYVTFLGGNTAITWSGGLGSGATASITVGANKRAILNGEINFGTSLEFVDLTPPISVNTSGPGKPYTQSCNSMFIDADNLNATRVSATEGAGDSASAFFIYSTNSNGTVIASATITSYNNQTGILSIDVSLAAFYRIQGAFVIT